MGTMNAARLAVARSVDEERLDVGEHPGRGSDWRATRSSQTSSGRSDSVGPAGLG